MYHSVILYGVYGYVVGVTAIAVLIGTGWSGWHTAAAIFFLLFVTLIWVDAKRKFDPSTTYVEDWRPIWRRT